MTVTAAARDPIDRSVLAAPMPIADRIEYGRSARERVPLESLGRWDPAVRGASALDVVLAQNATRVPELVPVRMGRMSVSAWTYYRGAAAVMAADLASSAHTGLDVHLCGDAHVLNFGLWATPERQLSFDLRDFDETMRGPFEWDVKRFLASLVVLARDVGLPRSTGRTAVAAALRAYRRRIARYAPRPSSRSGTTWSRPTPAAAVRAGRARALLRATREAGQAPHQRGRRTQADRKCRRAFADHRGPTDPRSSRRRASAAGDSPTWWPRSCRRTTTACRTSAATCSIGSPLSTWFVRWSASAASGCRCTWCFRGSRGDDPLFLQVKQAGPSVYEPYLGAAPYPITASGSSAVNG